MEIVEIDKIYSSTDNTLVNDNVADVTSDDKASNDADSNDTEQPCVILGITGTIGSGKSTVADYLYDRHNFQEYMFAEPLKKIAEEFGFEQHQIYGTQEQKLEVNEFWGISCRKFLQVFGSEICRNTLPKYLPDMKFNNTTVWVRLFEKWMQECRDDELDVVVSDVRYEDESKSITAMGGFIIRVVRPGVDTLIKDVTQTHASELQANKITPHAIINNDSDLPTLYKKLEMILDFIKKGIITQDTRYVSI
jgi:hypothetical protein